jgi:hypothetical protein
VKKEEKESVNKLENTLKIIENIKMKEEQGQKNKFEEMKRKKIEAKKNKTNCISKYIYK